VRPLVTAVALSARNAERDAGVSIVDAGDPALTARLAEVLGAPVRAPVPTDLLVCAPAPGADIGNLVHRLGAHRRNGGEVIVAVIGSPAARRRVLRQLAAAHDVGVSTAVPVASLAEAGAATVREAVVLRLGTFVVPAARTAPGLRDTAARSMVTRAARRAALVGAAPTSAPTTPVLSLMQARLLSDVTALGGARPGPREAGAAVGVAVAAPVFRGTARTLSRAVPQAAWAVRAGVAYGVTRGLGILAGRVRPHRSPPSEEDS